MAGSIYDEAKGKHIPNFLIIHHIIFLYLCSGICYEITKQLLLHGCTAAIICGRRENFLQKAAANLASISGQTCLYKVCDVRDPIACKSVVEYAVSQFGRVDILVNGAAGNFLSEAKSLTPKGFKTVMDIDAQGTFNMCSAVYPAMAGNGGSIINISMTLHYGGKKMLCNVNFFISCVLFFVIKN